MSIIYDALKKTEDKGRLNPGGSPRKKGKLFWLVFVICIALGLVFLLTKLPRKDVAVKTPQPEEVQTTKAAPASAMEKEPGLLAQDNTVAGEYFLEGIIYGQDNPLAIINGKILKKGDKIDDLELVNISPESVQLRNPEDNTSINLSLK